MKSHTISRGVALVAALTLVDASPALGAASGENTPLNLATQGAHHAAAGSGAGVLRTIVALVVVIAVIYAITWILRRAKRGKTSGGRSSGTGLWHVGALPLGPNRSVALVRAGRDVVLVGVSEQGVTPIRVYTEAEAVAAGLDLPVQEVDSGGRAAAGAERLMDALRRMTIRS